ncbi:hypothetical protein J1N35_039862 [Gossypium stocksii]|uniref:Endonuclease/exonuclease/phosphatase domain-containing protein n=1 Tax=Gossypium stocksii TaxID=47602 RepID=A0A9D3UCF6_9ROSI|nr:hypothetical protein J1N35_039862 [Gossypium stocksii]
MKWRLTRFYSSPDVHFKEESWNLLKPLGRDQRLSWLVCGDFNEILYSFGKKGGLPRDEGGMGDFRTTLVEFQLDRGVANSAWWLLFPNFSLRHLLHSFSYHCPLFFNH